MGPARTACRARASFCTCGGGRGSRKEGAGRRVRENGPPEKGWRDPLRRHGRRVRACAEGYTPRGRLPGRGGGPRTWLRPSSRAPCR
eukprot:1760799-Prymnesium_polylepis.1